MPPRTRKKRPTTSQRRNPPPPHHASPPPTSVPPVDSLSSAATTSTYTVTAYQSPLQDSDSESPIKQDCHQALEAFHRGNTKESFKIIKRSLSRHPNSPAVHRTLAFMHFQFSGASDYSARVQHFQKAAASSEKSLAISPKQIGLLFLHNHVLFELACDQEDCDRIIKQCQEALQIQDPIDPKNNIIVTRKETEAEDLATKDARIDSAKRELRRLVERVNQILQPHNESKEEGAAEKKDTAKEKDAAGEKNSMEDESGNYLNLGKPLASFVETRKAQEQIRHSIESILKEIRDLEIRLSCGYVDVNGTEEDERKKLRQSQVLDYWKRLSGEDRRRVLRVNIGEIMDYYANKKSIITLLTQAIDFWKKRGRWKFWSCCCCEEMHVEGVCWIDHVVAEHIDLPSSEKQEMFLPPKVDPAWADKIVNGVWKPVDVNKILKDTEGQETQAEIYRDEGKWPICEDSKREEMLKEIHAVLKLFLSNDCLSQSFVSGLIDDSNNHLQMSDWIPGLDQTPLCICFLGSDKLQQTLKLLQQISRQCQFIEPREDGIFYDEIHGEECTEMITLVDDFSCLLLHECFLTGEVESQKCSNAVPDDDNFVYWLYRSYDIEELTKTWTNCRSVKMLAATQAVRYQKLTFKYQLSLCKPIRWLAKYEQAFDAVNKICLAEENKRVHIPQHKPQSFLSLLLKRRDEIAGITDGDGMFEHRFIIDVLKLTEDTCVEHFGFEEVLIGMNTQLSDLKVAEDNEDSRITIQAAAAEPYLRQAMLSKLVNVRAQLFSFDALLMKSLADTRWMHHNFSMMPFHNYQPIMLHLVKSFLQAHLESFANNAARRAKGRHEPLLMLREAVLTVEKSKVDDDSRDEGKNTKNTKGKDKKKIKANLGIKEPQPSRKKNKEIILPTTSAGDDPDTRITSEMQEEDAPSSQISYNEMIELERNLEYQQKFEEEAKQKRLAEKKKNIIDNKPQNAEDEQLRRLIESEGMHIGQMIEQQKKIEDGIKQKRVAEQNKKIGEASIENTEDEMPLASKPGEVEKSSMPEKPPQNSQTPTVPVNTIRIGDLEVPLVSKPSWADRSSVLENPSNQFSTAIRIGDIYCKLHFPTEACSKPGETNVPIEHVQLEKSETVTLPGRDTAEVGDSHPPQAINVGLNETRNDSGEGKGIPDTGAGGIMYKPDAGICNDPDVLTMDHVLPYCRFFNRTKIKRSKGCKSYVSEDRGYSSEPEFGSHHHHVCLTCNAQPENLVKLPVCLQAAVWYFSRQNSERPL